MTWTVRLLGESGDDDVWVVSDLPADPARQDDEVRRRFPAGSLRRGRSAAGALTYVVRPAGAGPARRAPGPELSILSEDGPDAGRIAPVSPAGVSAGRGTGDLLLDDPTAPARPTRFALAAAGLTVRRPGRSTPEQWNGLEPLLVGRCSLGTMRGPQRPLDPPREVAAAVVDLGSPPGEQAMLLPLLMAAGPIVIGLVLALTSGSGLFLLFGLLSVLTVGTMIGLQRRARREHARALRGRASELAARRSGQAPCPGQVTRATRSRSADRFGVSGQGQDAACVLRWGTGMGPFPLSRPEAARQWQEAVVVSQPALSTLADERSITVTGARRPLDAAARWALFQLLRHAVAAGLTLTVTTPHGRECWWRGGAAARELHLGLPASDWVAPTRARWLEALGRADVAPPPSADPQRPVSEVRFSAEAEDPSVPSVPGDRLDLTARSLHHAGDGTTLADVVMTGISPATLTWWLLELADDVVGLGLLSGTTAAPPLRPPPQVGTLSAVDGVRAPVTTGDPARPAAGGPPATGGQWLDLAADGPHILVAGTTGSGKSDLLLSLLVGLSAHHPPAELAFILLDFKGGASFGHLAALPHTMSVETNHVGAASLRALSAISAELRRREALFAGLGVSDYPAFRRRRPDVALPRLVVAVDELRVLMDDHPDAGAVLQRLAATGRSLGFHLLLATQRATGAVSGDIRSNLGATIALRTATEQESWDLVGSRDAFHLDASRPGSAILSRAGRAPVAFRASQWAVAAAEPVWRRAGEEAVPAATAASWEAVVEHVRDAYAQGCWPTPAPVVSPALPGVWAPDRLSRRGRDALALIDDASRARHVVWRWPHGSAGNTAWIAEAAGGRELILESVLDVAARGPGGVLVLDGSGETGHPGLPHGHTVLTPDGGDEAAQAAVTALDALADHGGTAVVTGWAGWAGLRVGETYRSFDEELHHWLGTQRGRRVRFAALGGRDLATSRLLLHLPHRFYVPAGTSGEHRLVWPKVIAVEPLPGRAVFVSPDHPEPGIPAQLSFPSRGPARGPAAVSGPASTL